MFLHGSIERSEKMACSPLRCCSALSGEWVIDLFRSRGSQKEILCFRWNTISSYDHIFAVIVRHKITEHEAVTFCILLVDKNSLEVFSVNQNTGLPW